jgi:NTP pyrophosphatase (non-canonical NTP hydrolase)
MDSLDLEYVENGFDDYQEAASKTAIYPPNVKVFYPALGLAGEVGEVANKIKKHYRDLTPLDREELAKELGDVLWYVSALASDLGVSLGYVATENLKKLNSRKERGVLGGSGDER